MNLYNNPLVTYDEIVNAILEIIDCSTSTNYVADILNVKYEPSTNINNEDKYLNEAIESLKDSIKSSNLIIRKTLENKIGLDNNKLTINLDYKLGDELRKFACPNSIIDKLRKSSCDINSLYRIPGEDFEYNKYENIDTNKVYSDFERRAIVDFPDYFKEELSYAEEDNENVPTILATDLYNTMELSNLLEEIKSMNINTNPTTNIKDDKELAQEVKIIKEENKEDKKIDLVDSKLYTKLNLINKALKRAKENGNSKIVSYLEKELAKELNR